MGDWVRVQAISAGPLLKHFELSDEAEAVVVPEATTKANIEALIKAGCHHDAIKLLAHGLPKREAVWWSCIAARQAQTPQTDENNVKALIAAETWAKKPTEENREVCRSLGEVTKHNSPASWAATAASWCSGSLAAPDEPEIQPPEYLYAHAVAGCVSLAASLVNPEDPEGQMEEALMRGFNIAEGGNGLI
ncbi:DUF6931 family protein [Marinibactrum halimedae]|uniref:Uncharacterized protein n=1 Tax=Marinibactrum halimedae TaxID=1444977 RepID=A0AA37T9L0_9GAMM|nr:hypothetical protein [Marinibactrum halimedae]MCD9458398.1 hypothetical protein [Marinibactrum halimedae]GLS26095.1 hypothetical protein GCM10007877_18100 [Marinibactrum halimedae]